MASRHRGSRHQDRLTFTKEIHHVLVGRRQRRHPVAAGQLDPAPPRVHQPQQRLEARLPHAVSRPERAHVVDHDVGGQFAQGGLHLGQRSSALVIHDVELHMPTQAGDARRQRGHLGQRDGTCMADVVAHSPHAGFVQAVQFGILHLGPQRDDDARRPAQLGHRLQVPPVVGAIAAGLHEHQALDAQGVVQRAQPRRQGVGHIEGARRGHGIAVGGAIDMHMAIRGPRRADQPGLAGSGIGRLAQRNLRGSSRARCRRRAAHSKIRSSCSTTGTSLFFSE